MTYKDLQANGSYGGETPHASIGAGLGTVQEKRSFGSATKEKSQIPAIEGLAEMGRVHLFALLVSSSFSARVPVLRCGLWQIQPNLQSPRSLQTLRTLDRRVFAVVHQRRKFSIAPFAFAGQGQDWGLGQVGVLHTNPQVLACASPRDLHIYMNDRIHLLETHRRGFHKQVLGTVLQ